MDTDDWRQDQKVAFGARLTAARKALQKPNGKPLYKRPADFIPVLAKRLPDAKLRAYYNWESGARVPRDDRTIAVLAELLRVSVRWLMFGEGDKQVNDNSLMPRARPINQTTETLELNHSKPSTVRYIYLLTVSDIKNMVIGKGGLPSMAADQFTVPPQVAAGPRSYAYQIPPHDESMVGGAGLSFPPGTILTIDPDRDILPGDFFLVWPEDHPAPVMRRLQAPWAFTPRAPRYPFTLRALNPLAEPLVVAEADEAVVLGRVVAYSHVL